MPIEIQPHTLLRPPRIKNRPLRNVVATLYAEGRFCETVSLCFPEFMLGTEIVKPCVRAVPALGYLSRGDRGGHGAARLSEVRAVVEAALSYVRRKVDEVVLKLLLGDDVHHLDLEGSKAGCVGNKGIIPDVVKLNMAGGMSAAPELFAHLAGLYPEIRDKGIEYA